MKLFDIIWDFDGTLLPSDPCDSEHTLLLQSLNAPGERPSLIKRVVARCIVFFDQRQWMGPAFKKYYAWVLEGTPADRLDPVAQTLARKIPEADRVALRQLRLEGHAMRIISCGTLDLIERVLALTGIRGCFETVEGNRLLFSDGRISGIKLEVVHPADKVKMLVDKKIRPERTLAVGDGYTDLPLLQWAGFPVLMDRSGKTKNRRYARYPKIASIAEVGTWLHRLSDKRESA